MSQTIASIALPANAKSLAWFNHAVDILGLADADINTNSGATGGVAGLVAIIKAKTKGGVQGAPIAYQAGNAVQAGKDIGTLTDSNVNGVTTLAGVQALYTSQDSTLTAGYRNTFGFPQ